MKALISPKESFTLSWISSWQQVEGVWQPVYSEILNCQRVAEVLPDNQIFPVAPLLFWFDCPNDCVADRWYYKENAVYIKPSDAPKPE